jgi:NADPH2 dehydrogenase
MSRLFEFLTVGRVTINHRVAMAPLTRMRASEHHVISTISVDYYSQRSSIPGTLLISEATLISAADGGIDNVPGIYNEIQIEAWRNVTNAVHKNGSHIYCQLWAMGRAADPMIAQREGFDFIGADAIPISDDAQAPRCLNIEEIQAKIKTFVSAAKNAIAAGFDGVELHGANGFLIDQFLQDRSNQRSDRYGGSIENRSQFLVEVVQAVCHAIGADRTGLRLSPWSPYNGMKMTDPLPQFRDVIQRISIFRLAYLHLVEPRISGGDEIKPAAGWESLEFAYDLWQGPIIVAGGHTPQSARELVDISHSDKDIIVAFGRYFISTPDLPLRIMKNIDFSPYDRTTFYTPGPSGYIDYPYHEAYCN